MAEDSLRGSTDLFYFWHDEYGFVHISDREKILESYEQFKEKMGKQVIMCSSPAPRRNFFYDLMKQKLPRIEEHPDSWDHPGGSWVLIIQAVEDYPGMEHSDKTSSMEVPKSHADDVGVWVHEFVEITVSWMLHTVLKRESGSKWDGIGDVPQELNPKIHVGRCTHYVQHIMSALTTISGFDWGIIPPDEYAEKLPWKNKNLTRFL